MLLFTSQPRKPLHWAIRNGSAKWKVSTKRCWKAKPWTTIAPSSPWRNTSAILQRSATSRSFRSRRTCKNYSLKSKILVLGQFKKRLAPYQEKHIHLPSGVALGRFLWSWTHPNPLGTPYLKINCEFRDTKGPSMFQSNATADMSQTHQIFPRTPYFLIFCSSGSQWTLECYALALPLWNYHPPNPRHILFQIAK